MSNYFKPVIEDRFDRAARLIKEARSSKESSAPLDPAKVKAGDTVTLQGDKASVEGEVQEVEIRTDVGRVVKLHHSWFRIDGDGAWTLTDHQPAPEPEPEWKVGQLADITIGDGSWVRAIRAEVRDDEHVWQTIPSSSWWSDANVTDVRPLVVIDPAAVDVDALVEVAHHDRVLYGDTTPDQMRRAILRILAHMGIEATS